MELALYDPTLGFFATGGGAGRAGADFVTSPEVGPLFGTLVARALDGWWDDLDRPDPFLVVEAGAGHGRLAREVLRAEPRCAAALRYVLVERSPVLREAQRRLLAVEPFEDALGPVVATPDGEAVTPVPRTGPIVTALDALPALQLTGVVLANELLDNLPFDVVERTASGWSEVRVGLAPDGALMEVPVPAGPELGAWLAGVDVPVGARLPVQTAVEEWLEQVASVLRAGFVAVADYTATVAELAARGQAGWLRTYRAHGRGGDPLDAPGSQDVTADVCRETLARAAVRAGLDVVTDTTQAEWLATLGIDALVAEGDAIWRERAHVGDLAALAARSRGVEAAALTDPAGLGAHRVVVLRRRR